jgi:phospholipase/carboxylesterase
MELTQLGRLRARIVAPPGAVRRVCVLMHGFGAPGDDLVALVDWIDAPGTTYVFPEAPMVLGGAYGSARADVIALLDAVAQRYTAPLFLGGFSQGAMLACDVALHTERPLAGLLLLSGTLIARAEWEPRMAARAGLRVLQSHGRYDPLLPFSAAEKLRDLLAGAGLKVGWVPFDGGHEIPPPLLDAVGELLTGA